PAPATAAPVAPDKPAAPAARPGSAATVVVTPAVLALMGFTATGIAAGSFAAWLMSFFAQYYGGGIISGTIVAILQSFGNATGAATRAPAAERTTAETIKITKR
uniref:Uncharacterized protein n=1 Tax=Kryptolebias marmoratus TaxID=37003 RepID=A0A3Q3ASZ7_KRYMA